MDFSFLKQINWIDIFFAIILMRICYISMKTGFPTEIFKLLGTLCAILIACHNYVRITNFLNQYLSLKSEGGINFLNALIFFLLVCLGYLIFVLIRLVFTVLIKMEAVSLLNRWGAFIIGIVRFSLFAGLILFTVNIWSLSYIKESSSNSFSGPVFSGLPAKIYSLSWSSLLFRFMDEKAFNKAVFEVGGNPSQ